MVNRLVLVTVWPLRSNTAPLVTMTAFVAAPKAEALPNCTVPKLIVKVFPAPKVFAPLRVNVPRPTLARL